MRVHLEFLGLSRLVAGVTEISLDLEEGTTFRDIVPKLGTTYPAMRESVSRPDSETLQNPNAFSLNAKRMIQASQMNDRPSDGDRIILMSMSIGG